MVFIMPRIVHQGL